jgi:hypothetical protein
MRRSSIADWIRSHRSRAGSWRRRLRSVMVRVADRASRPWSRCEDVAPGNAPNLLSLMPHSNPLLRRLRAQAVPQPRAGPPPRYFLSARGGARSRDAGATQRPRAGPRAPRALTRAVSEGGACERASYGGLPDGGCRGGPLKPEIAGSGRWSGSVQACPASLDSRVRSMPILAIARSHLVSFLRPNTRSRSGGTSSQPFA